jgi:hypothetical protein
MTDRPDRPLDFRRLTWTPEPAPERPDAAEPTEPPRAIGPGFAVEGAEVADAGEIGRMMAEPEAEETEDR